MDAERHRWNVFDPEVPETHGGITRQDRVRNDEIRRKAGIEETLAEKVDKKMLCLLNTQKSMQLLQIVTKGEEGPGLVDWMG